MKNKEEKIIHINHEIFELISRYKILSKDKKVLESDMDELKAQILSKINDYGILVSPDGEIMGTLTKQKCIRFDTKRFKSEDEQSFKMYSIETESDYLRV